MGWRINIKENRDLLISKDLYDELVLLLDINTHNGYKYIKIPVLQDILTKIYYKELSSKLSVIAAERFFNRLNTLQKYSIDKGRYLYYRVFKSKNIKVLKLSTMKNEQLLEIYPDNISIEVIKIIMWAKKLYSQGTNIEINKDELIKMLKNIRTMLDTHEDQLSDLYGKEIDKKVIIIECNNLIDIIKNQEKRLDKLDKVYLKLSEDRFNEFIEV